VTSQPDPTPAQDVAQPASEASPAGATGALVLTAPPAVTPVAPPQAETAISIEPAEIQKLDRLVDTYLDGVTSLDLQGPEFRRKVEDVRTLGDEDIRKSAAVSNTLLEKPLAAMNEGGLTQGSSVSKSLLELRRTVEDLDPAQQGDLFSPKKLLGILPFGAGDKLRDYFGKYQSSQTHLNRIIQSLYSGQDELRRDNAAIIGEQQRLWETNGRLRQYLYMGHQLDAKLVERIAAIEATDPQRANVLRQDLLFYVRQKVQDLATQLAVGVQGYLALDLIRKNNLELVKGVDRATTTTVSALRTAVIVAQALADQKLVLDQITALNTTTGNIIESTSQMLRDQSGRVNEQAVSSTVSLEQLQHAFANIYATMDEIDTFKLKALDNMGRTVASLETELAKAQSYLDRAHAGADPGSAQSDLTLQ
jgi:uncharacterized protein YaaN involved in tellurite resistance